MGGSACNIVSTLHRAGRVRLKANIHSAITKNYGTIIAILGQDVVGLFQAVMPIP
jgi:hypothetical protein